MSVDRQVEQGRPDASERLLVGTYGSYAEAEAAVDHLSDRRFPVEHVSIVAHGVRLVEEVTGRVGYGRAALNGIYVGVAVGALFGFVAGIFSWVDPLVSAVLLALYGAVFGAILGALLGLAGHAATRGRRDFASYTQVSAEGFEVRADEDVAEQARRLLEEQDGARG